MISWLQFPFRGMMLTTAAILVLATFVTCGTAYYGGSPVLEAMAEPLPDYETTNYLLPRLMAKYHAPHPSQGDWESASDPRFYLLTELDRDATQAATRRVKRTGGGPSLSIVNPLDVLRQRLLLEIARRRMRQSQDQIQANRDFLQSIGKREVANHTDNEVADYIVSPAAEKSGMPVPETNRSPVSPEWSAVPASRWSNEYTSLHQS